MSPSPVSRVTIEFDCTPAEYRAASQILTARKLGKKNPKPRNRAVQHLAAVGFILLIMSSILIRQRQSRTTSPITPAPPVGSLTIELPHLSLDAAIVAGVFALAVLLFIAGARMIARADRLDRDRWKHQINFTFDDDGFLMERPGKSDLLTWLAFEGFNQTAKLFIIRDAADHGYVIPKRLFANPVDLQFVTALLEEKLGPRQRRDRGFEVIPK